MSTDSKFLQKFGMEEGLTAKLHEMSHFGTVLGMMDAVLMVALAASKAIEDLRSSMTMCLRRREDLG